MVSALRSKIVACVLVLFTFVGTTGAWHVADDDPDYVTPVGHDHAAHHERINRSTSAQPPSHCAICHWLQGFRTDSVPSTAVGGAAKVKSQLSTHGSQPRQLLVRLDVPSRAPPAQL